MHHCTQATGARDAAGGKGFDYRGSFVAVRDVLRAADLTVGNLEVPVDGLHKDHCFPLFSAPAEYLDAVADAGFDVVSLANNHALDRGTGGLERTVARAEALGLAVAGVTPGREAASLTVRGVRVAILGITSFLNLRCREAPCPLAAGPDEDVGPFDGRVRELAATHDLVVVFVHWMQENRQAPTRAEQAQARRLLDAGATAVIGHHPHVLAPGEWVVAGDGTTRYIRWSLGSFVHAMKSTTTRLAGIETLRLRRTPAGWTVAGAGFLPTVVRRNDGAERPKRFQPVPLDPALAQCASGDGPFMRLSKHECADLRWFREQLDLHPGWGAAPAPPQPGGSP